MGPRPWLVTRPFVFLAFLLWSTGIPSGFAATPEAAPAVSVKPPAPSAQPIQITAEHLEYLQNVDVYEADGSVVVIQGPLRLTADHITLMMLTGTMVATGHVHLTDPTSDLHAERLELDVNTDSGVVTNGKLYIKQSNTLITGRILQRFSETHYRAKDGSFTNCDAQEGQIPAWRFTFEDFDLNVGEGVYGKKVWFCVNDKPLIRLPSLFYPIQTARKTGWLIPTAGYDNRFGLTYRQSFFWAINPHQDAIVSPNFLSNRGYGADLEYRYVLNRLSRGEWLLSFLQDTTENKPLLLMSGLHRQQVNPNLTINARAFLLSDTDYLTNLSNSGVQRALPSGDSFLNVNQRFTNGNLYLLGQYLQPITAGGKDSFQRLPEIGYSLVNVAPLNGPVLLGMDTAVMNWGRDEGFGFQRVDLMPSLSTDVLSVGHVVGIRPQVRLRDVYYTRGVTDETSVNRGTFWAALQADSRLTRRFTMGENRSLMHTIEPRVIYEFVPATNQSDIIQVDAVDNLPYKNLITYSLTSRLFEQKASATLNSWMDLTIAQSYHVGRTQSQAVDFFFAGNPLFGSETQPLQPPTVAVDGTKFSNIWTRAVIGNPVNIIRTIDHVLTIDAFYDPYGGGFSQFNADLRFQHEKLWYVEVGERHTRAGNRPQRGDIWNPYSFGDVFAPTPEINFVTLSAAFKGPFGLILGARTYYDFQNGNSPETDVVALYRNPCQCWSVGFYYIQFPDRVNYNFMVSLTGIGATQNFGTEIMKYLLYPLTYGERGLPWASPYGMRTTPTAAASQPLGLP